MLVRDAHDSSRVTVTYFPFPCFTQGLIVASDAAARTVDVAIDVAGGYPLPDAASPATSFFNSTEIKLQFWSPVTRGRVPGQSGSCVVRVAGAVSPGVWRLSDACAVPAGVPGMLATISPRIGATYDIPQFYRGGAYWVHNSSNTYERGRRADSGNFVFTEWGGEGGHTYRRVALTRAWARTCCPRTRMAFTPSPSAAVRTSSTRASPLWAMTR